MYSKIREEELKNKVGEDWFEGFDTTEILGNIDFTVFPKQDSLFGRNPLLWAEAKTGDYNTTTMFVQLILTIGKAKIFDKTLPPAFLGAFDFVKMAFVPYIAVEDIFYENDFNWNVTPSDHSTKEFQKIKDRVESILEKSTYVFEYKKDKKDLESFIKNNISKSKENAKIKINKNNFIPIYLKWLEFVKPTINIDWEDLRKNNILDSDFYLADLFVDDKNTQDISDDQSIYDNLFVVFQNKGYKIAKEDLKQMFDATISISEPNRYQNFWKSYKRPPQKKFQEFIIKRRDLLVPQDIRERKGAFFTPRVWVELSQKYMTEYFGENWQDEYYIWDCAAGTGNLLAGLTNKYNIYASTLDQADVNVMHERIENGANLLESHIFQFDFLNDDFSKLPESLQEIINDEEKRKKLIIYINPPYAEAGNKQTTVGKGEHKKGVSLGNYVYDKYGEIMSKARNELFAQFLIRIYKEIPGSKIADFSKLKNLQGSNFKIFRQNFQPKLEKLFLTPADTFDNVRGKFPIGFFIWNGEVKEKFEKITADVYNKNGEYVGGKLVSINDSGKSIVKWIGQFKDKKTKSLAMMNTGRTDFQHNNLVFISHYNNDVSHSIDITKNNLTPAFIYFAVRLCQEATWLNDRDQFLYPKDGWQNDKEFHSDCLAFTLFHGQNRISSEEGINNWIPFTEQQVDAKERFESHFMTDFIAGKIKPEQKNEQLSIKSVESPISQNVVGGGGYVFSIEAEKVFEAGKKLWKYYHSKDGVNVNASLYDIRAYFQGRNEKGRMNSKSEDKEYMKLIGNLRAELKVLGGKISEKVYEYEFLKES